MNYTCKPIVEWPDKLTPRYQRKRGSFSTTYARTLEHLDRELKHLKATQIVFQLALDESDIRIDGRPRATARPAHPGVIVSFNSKHGALSYWTDEYTDWQSNVRAISLALEALRAVDRHGVNKSGSQYQGYKRLNAGEGSKTGNTFTPETAAAFIASYCPVVHGAIIEARHILSDQPFFESAYKRAARMLHPDNVETGHHERFIMLQNAAAVLKQRGWKCG